MSFKRYIQNNEKIFRGENHDIKYIFCKGKIDKIIVTFPGFSSHGGPEYNYIRTLMESNAHRLYLLDDFGPKGSYFIGKSRDNSIEASVFSLILSICRKYDIKFENVILQGSSKGGYSALYFGIKYGFGYVIAGAPQTKLGHYVLSAAPEVAEYVSGGMGEDDRRYLNNLLFDLIYFPLNNFPKIFIHIGNGDHHYNTHIIPFVKELERRCIYYQLDVQNYYSHSDISLYYPDYLVKTLYCIDQNIIDLTRFNQKFIIKLENKLNLILVVKIWNKLFTYIKKMCVSKK